MPEETTEKLSVSDEVFAALDQHVSWRMRRDVVVSLDGFQVPSISDATRTLWEHDFLLALAIERGVRIRELTEEINLLRVKLWSQTKNPRTEPPENFSSP